jgi:hypothetical protein
VNACALSHLGDCDGRVQEHHIVKRQSIRRVWRSLMAAKRRGGPKPWSVTKAIADPRNKVNVCWHHHKPVEEGRLAVPLPAGFYGFVNEYGLQGQLPRQLREVA